MKRVRLLIYDASQRGADEQFLSVFWAAWGAFGGFTYVVPCRKVADVVPKVLAEVPRGVVLDGWEFAGHGRSGAPLIDGEPVTPALFGAGLKPRTNAETVGWIRTCDAYRDKGGQRFAVDLVAAVGHPVAGHTRVVSQFREGRTYGGLLGGLRAQADLAIAIAKGILYQSGCYVLRPNETPHWDPDDGGYSGPDEPNTALLTDKRPPASAWQ